MLRIEGLREVSLYFDDLEAAARFYGGVLGLAEMFRDPRLVAFDAGGGGVLLLFRRGASTQDTPTAGGVIPGHDGNNRLHLALSIPAGSCEAWRTRLAGSGVALTGEVKWKRGGRSLYFNDPEGHVVELATPGVWPNG